MGPCAVVIPTRHFCEARGHCPATCTGPPHSSDQSRSCGDAPVQTEPTVSCSHPSPQLRCPPPCSTPCPSAAAHPGHGGRLRHRKEPAFPQPGGLGCVVLGERCQTEEAAASCAGPSDDVPEAGQRAGTSHCPEFARSCRERDVQRQHEATVALLERTLVLGFLSLLLDCMHLSGP